jgi:hypothetical protein
MHNYLSDLGASELPFSVTSLAAIWVLLFGLAHVLERYTRSVSHKQAHVVHLSSIDTGPQWKVLFGQAFSAAIVFGLSGHFGGAVAVLFAGGWVLVALYVIASNLRSLFFTVALARPNAATGSVTFGTRMLIQSQAVEYLTGAAIYLCLGLLIPHMAPLGASLVLTASGVGMFRKSYAGIDADASVPHSN